MLVFPNKSDFAPQPWVPRDVATYVTMYVDIGQWIEFRGRCLTVFGGVTFLFSLDLKYQADLDKATISPAFRAEFAERANLGENAAIKIKADSVWEIHNSKGVYVIRKSQGVLRVSRKNWGSGRKWCRA